MILKALIISFLALTTLGNDDAGSPEATAEFTEADAFEFLTKTGFAKDSLTTFTVGDPGESLNNIIRNFQNYAGLEETGELDTNTIDVMVAPRCGVLFAEEQGDGTTPRWNKKTLTYRIKEYSRYSGLTRGEVDNTIRKAFDFWEGAADLKFHETSGRADIEIEFGTWSHGDGLEFDGQGGVLAHAYYPSTSEIAGDAHFDDDEAWSVRDYVGKQLLQTATHELGHSLGLSHSRVKGSVMYFSYPGWDPKLRLHNDDIDRIQKIYGRQTRPITPITPRFTTAKPISNDGPCECADYTRWDSGSSQSIGNCKTEYKSKKWCYIDSGARCSDKRKSSSVNRHWSWEACAVKKSVPKIQKNCQCNGITRYDSRKDETVGHCQTEYRGDLWCYISSDSSCEDKKGTRRNTNGLRYWSGLACQIETPFQRETQELEDVQLVFPGQEITTKAPGTP